MTSTTNDMERLQNQLELLIQRVEQLEQTFHEKNKNVKEMLDSLIENFKHQTEKLQRVATSFNPIHKPKPSTLDQSK